MDSTKAILLAAFASITFASHEGGERFIAVPDSDGVQRVYVRAGSYYYRPSHIVVRKGRPVELVLIRESAVIPHNIVMSYPEAGMDFRVEIYPDRPVRISFTPTRTGRFEFYCDKKLLFFPSHREKGMHGVIEVIE